MRTEEEDDDGRDFEKVKNCSKDTIEGFDEFHKKSTKPGWGG